MPAFTRIGGPYQRAAKRDNAAPFELPPRWAGSNPPPMESTDATGQSRI